MASIRPADVDPAQGILYMTLDGSVLCVSEGLTNLLGWESKEVFGQSINSLALDGLDLEQGLTAIKVRDPARCEVGSRAGGPRLDCGAPGAILRSLTSNPLRRSQDSLSLNGPVVQPSLRESQKERTSLAESLGPAFSTKMRRVRMSDVGNRVAPEPPREAAPETNADRAAPGNGKELFKNGSLLLHRSGNAAQADKAGELAQAEVVSGMAAVIRHKYLKTGLASKASFSLVGRRDDAIVAMTVALDEEPGGILVCSRDGRILYVNSPLESALGYPAGSLIDAGANVSHLMPRGFGRFHQTRLPRAVVSSDCAAMHVPCQMGQVVILRGNQGAQVPVLLSWTTQREAATAPMYVCLARKTGPNAALAPWGFRSIEGQVEQQICLHILVDRQGSIVAVGHGTGFVKEGVAGGVFGINAETLASANVADFIEVLSATVTAARKFNPSIPVGDVMAGALEQLSRVGAASGIASFRTAFRCPPGPYSAAEDLVPARLAVQRVAATRVNLPSLRKLGVLRGEADVEAVRDGFVLDVWSANWLQGELQVSPAGVFLTASARMEVLSGRPASRLVRSALSSLFVEDTPGQVDDVLEGRKPSAELHLRHADDSTLRVSLLGSGDTVSAGKKRVTLVVRAVQEACEPATEALHRMQARRGWPCALQFTVMPALVLLLALQPALMFMSPAKQLPRPCGNSSRSHSEDGTQTLHARPHAGHPGSRCRQGAVARAPGREAGRHQARLR